VPGYHENSKEQSRETFEEDCIIEENRDQVLLDVWSFQKDFNLESFLALFKRETYLMIVF